MKRRMLPVLCLMVLAIGITPKAQVTIEVLAPNGGETFVVGDTMRIQWLSTDTIPQAVVDISVDGGEDWLGLLPNAITYGTSAWGDTFWVVQPSIIIATDTIPVPSDQCLVKIYQYGMGSNRDVSDATFTILAEAPSPPDGDEDGDSGCGSGAGAAFVPALLFRASRRWRRHRKKRV